MQHRIKTRIINWLLSSEFGRWADWKAQTDSLGRFAWKLRNDIVGSGRRMNTGKGLVSNGVTACPAQVNVHYELFLWLRHSDCGGRETVVVHGKGDELRVNVGMSGNVAHFTWLKGDERRWWWHESRTSCLFSSIFFLFSSLYFIYLFFLLWTTLFVFIGNTSG